MATAGILAGLAPQHAAAIGLCEDTAHEIEVRSISGSKRQAIVEHVVETCEESEEGGEHRRRFRYLELIGGDGQVVQSSVPESLDDEAVARIYAAHVAADEAAFEARVASDGFAPVEPLAFDAQGRAAFGSCQIRITAGEDVPDDTYGEVYPVTAAVFLGKEILAAVPLGEGYDSRESPGEFVLFAPADAPLLVIRAHIRHLSGFRSLDDDHADDTAEPVVVTASDQSHPVLARCFAAQ